MFGDRFQSDTGTLTFVSTLVLPVARAFLSNKEAFKCHLAIMNYVSGFLRNICSFDCQHCLCHSTVSIVPKVHYNKVPNLTIVQY